MSPPKPEQARFSTKALEDFRLIDRAFEGDTRVYALLMQRYQRSVYHTVLKMIRREEDAEDLTIEAFEKAFRNLSKFKKDYAFSTWLFRIAINNTLDHIRKQRLRTISLDNAYTDNEGKAVALHIADRNPTPQELAIRTQKETIIRGAVNRLPVKYQQLVRLRFFDELSYEEIAETIDLPLGTVKAQLHRSKELLFDLMKHQRERI